ncbi:MAG: hypothetical protein WC562_03750 [Dehalococcoidia bacterium]
MVYYSRDVKNKELAVYRFTCPICNQEANLRLIKQTREEWLLIIPHWGSDYFFTCGNCWKTFKVKKEFAKQLERGVFNRDALTPGSIQCPKCGSQTEIRVVKKGPDSGKEFHVCKKYPKCKGRVQVRKADSNGG